MDIFGWFSAIFDKGDNFVISFLSCKPVYFWKGSFLKEKNLLPLGSIFSFFRVGPLLEGR